MTTMKIHKIPTFIPIRLATRLNTWNLSNLVAQMRSTSYVYHYFVKARTHETNTTTNHSVCIYVEAHAPHAPTLLQCTSL